MIIENLVETAWLSRYPCPSKITYDRGYECLGHDFLNNLIKEEYFIIAKPETAENQQTNSIIGRIHKVVANLIWTFEVKKYVD